MATEYFVLSTEAHDRIVTKNFLLRGYDQSEAEAVARIGRLAAWHGVRTHNAIKAISIDNHLGSKVGAYKPGAKIKKKEGKFKAVESWNANLKSGPLVAFEAMQRAVELAEEYGVGTVSVDNATHYLWGGGYVLEASSKGYIAYTACTSAASEVVPYLGKTATLGTNPHSWAFPTKSTIGFDICIDWATSMIAWGRVEQFAREGKELPQGSALDKDGQPTTDPKKVAALTTFGAHKGYSLALIDELWAAFIGGSLPTLRGRSSQIENGDKYSACFIFQCIHPEAISADNFAFGRSQAANVKEILQDILSHGNENSRFPGQGEAENAKLSEKFGGLLFTAAEIGTFKKIAEEAAVELDVESLKKVRI